MNKKEYISAREITEIKGVFPEELLIIAAIFLLPLK
jgi:hypothetical protein